MGNWRKEFSGILCSVYMTALLAVLPVYIQGSYWKLGDVKYLFFRNVSWICLGLWAAVSFGGLSLKVCREAGHWRRGKNGRIPMHLPGEWSSMDTAAALYGVMALVSCICSPYRHTAWFGYRDWYMGAMSQLLFVGIYFFVSRCWQQQKPVLGLGEASLAAVTLLGLLNRLGIDPLGLYAGYGEVDWEYSHMLSTTGNINWLCGYLSLALVLPVTGYLECDKFVRKWMLYGISVSGLLLLCIQGSDSGPVLAAALLFGCLLMSGRKTGQIIKTLVLAGGTALSIPVMSYFVSLLGSVGTMPYDGKSHSILWWPGWWVAAGVAFTAAFFIRKGSRAICLCRKDKIFPSGENAEAENKAAAGDADTLNHADAADKSGGLSRTTHTGPVHRFGRAAIALTIFAAVLAVFYLRKHPLEDSWGTGRGELWRIAGEGFAAASPLRKLIGVGPDCFAEALDTNITMVGHWADSVFANAHNEWLNQLVNTGILGTGCYLGIFLAAAKRFRGIPLGMLAVGLYLVNSLVSFQQVLNAPLLFLLLGICENTKRGQSSTVQPEMEYDREESMTEGQA